MQKKFTVQRGANDFMLDELNNGLRSIGLSIEGKGDYGYSSYNLKRGIDVVGMYVVEGDYPFSVIIYEGPINPIEGLEKVAEENKISLRYRLTGESFTETFTIIRNGIKSEGHIIHRDYFNDPIMGMLKYVNKKNINKKI